MVNAVIQQRRSYLINGLHFIFIAEDWIVHHGIDDNICSWLFPERIPLEPGTIQYTEHCLPLSLSRAAFLHLPVLLGRLIFRTAEALWFYLTLHSGSHGDAQVCAVVWKDLPMRSCCTQGFITRTRCSFSIRAIALYGL